ncbi:MAG: AMP nucleosidase [Maritimibacter sp.]
MTPSSLTLPVVTPIIPEPESFTDPAAAVARLEELYETACEFLSSKFSATAKAGTMPDSRYRAYYPEIRMRTTSHAQADTRLSFGYVAGPGTYSTTVTRPDLFRSYLTQQIALLIEHHNVPISIGLSSTPIPIHFAVAGREITVPQEGAMSFPMRDVFDVPDLTTTHDDIANGLGYINEDGSEPLAPFTAQRVDYSLARLSHYTATDPVHFQNHVLFTNYDGEIPVLPKLPQMPTYHLKRADGSGVTLVNIGVGPSNAKTATDHIAVLRPHAWLMVGHCAGLRNSQQLGDFVLAHAYLREDKVLDSDLPTWVPIPPLAEIQKALEGAVADVTKLEGYGLKRIMRTGTVASFDNRNWELREHSGPVLRLSQSRAVALDMESATIAANGFRFRVPYGTLLCVSDKPLHGELKLPGMASDFYTTQVSRHLLIGIRAMELLRDMPLERIHSRKLRSFDETAFL